MRSHFLPINCAHSPTVERLGWVRSVLSELSSNMYDETLWLLEATYNWILVRFLHFNHRSPSLSLSQLQLSPFHFDQPPLSSSHRPVIRCSFPHLLSPSHLRRSTSSPSSSLSLIFCLLNSSLTLSSPLLSPSFTLSETIAILHKLLVFMQSKISWRTGYAILPPLCESTGCFGVVS